MNMGTTAAESPTLFRRKDLVGGTDPPFGDGLDPVSRFAEQRDGTGSALKQAAQAFGSEAKDLFPRGTGLKDASEFADLGDLGSLAAGIVEQTSDLLVGCSKLFLRGFAPGDLLLLVELGEGQPQGESEKRCGDRRVGERLSVCLFPVVSQ